MALISFENIDIWPSYGQTIVCLPIFEHTYFGHNSAISGPPGLKFFMGVQETIFYRLVMRNLCYDAYFSVLILRLLLAGIWAWSPNAPLMVWGLQTQPKSWSTWRTFWANRYLEIMFSKFSRVNPPPLK